MKKALLDVAGNIAGATLSRTVPVHAKAFDRGPTDAPAVSYEMLSAMNIASGGGAWDGMLHRMRHECSVAGVVGVAALDLTTNPVGDKFEENLKNVTTNKRKLWTVLTTDNTTKSGAPRRQSPHIVAGVHANPRAIANNFCHIGGRCSFNVQRRQFSANHALALVAAVGSFSVLRAPSLGHPAHLAALVQ